MQSFSKALSLKMSGEHEKAIKILEMLLLNDFDNNELWEEIADNQLSLNRNDLALSASKMAIQIAPKSPNAQYLTGFAYSRMFKWEESIEHLEKAEELFPNHPEILRCLGWGLYHNDRKQNGIAIMSRSAMIEESPHTLIDLAVLYMQEKEYLKAFSCAQKAYMVNPCDDRVFRCYILSKELSHQ